MPGIQALARLGKGIYPGWPVWAAKQDLYLRKTKKKKKIKRILEKNKGLGDFRMSLVQQFS